MSSPARARPAATLAAMALGLTACSGASPDDDGGGSAATGSGTSGSGTSSSPSSSPDDGSGSSPGGDGSASTGSPSDGTGLALADTLATGLDVPWAIAFTPEGDALVTLRDEARLVRVSTGGDTRDVGEVPGVQPDGEGGLLGVAINPELADEVQVFLYLTGEEDNRVVRGTLGEDGLGELTPVVTGIAKGSIHNGGRLAFGPDGYLYVSTGDAGQPERAQDEGSLNGKILRVTTDGEPAPGNPDADSPVWSSGHRNVQGMAWTQDGTMVASEFGQNTWDELNVITKGSNYGWPEVEGDGGQEGFVDPVAVWRTSEASPSGVAVGEDGAVYMTALGGRAMWRVPLEGSGEEATAGDPQRLLFEEYGRLRDVVRADDGRLWTLTSNTFRGDPGEDDDRLLVLEQA